MMKWFLSIIEYAKIYKRYVKYRQHFRELIRLQHIANNHTPGEKEYEALWKQLSSHVEPYSYRLFRYYCGDSPYIVPEDIGHSFVEPRLNPKRFTPFYEDKNMLPVLLPFGIVPRTILCRINGSYIMDGGHRKGAIGWNSSAASLFARMGGVRLY